MHSPVPRLQLARRRASRGVAILLAILPVAMVGCFRSPTENRPAERNIAPQVSAAATPDSGLVPLTVTFSGNATDSDGSIVSSRWDFGDGTSSDRLTSQHIYSVPGDYEAVLVAADDRGATASTRVKVHARGKSNRQPTAVITAVPLSGVAPLAVSFAGQGTDSDGSVVAYNWTFGDGSSSSDQNPSHTFTSPAEYAVRLTVTDNGGATGRDMVKVLVTGTGTPNQPPTASASAVPTSGTAPLAVTFSGTGSDNDGTIASYAWTFGDGGTSSLQNPSHTYTGGGNYTARLTVTDNLGATGSATVAITASTPANLAPVANAGPDQLNKDPGTTIALTGAGSSDPDGAIASYTWSQISGPAVTLTGANTATPSFQSQPGTTASYGFTLTVTDNGSPAKTASDNVVVSTRVTYNNLVGALLLARGTQPSGMLLGCTSSGCHDNSGGLSPLTNYMQVYSSRTSVKSKISPGGSMLKFLLAGESSVIISWIDAGAVEKN